MIRYFREHYLPCFLTHFPHLFAGPLHFNPFSHFPQSRALLEPQDSPSSFRGLRISVTKEFKQIFIKCNNGYYRLHNLKTVFTLYRFYLLNTLRKLHRFDFLYRYLSRCHLPVYHLLCKLRKKWKYQRNNLNLH